MGERNQGVWATCLIQCPNVLQEYSSKEKESRTRTTSKGSSHKKQNVLKEN